MLFRPDCTAPMTMNYKHLHYFWTVMRTGSIARASAQLHLTPQTLSGQIKQLEEHFGTRLFERAHGRVSLTPEGVKVKVVKHTITQVMSKTEPASV